MEPWAIHAKYRPTCRHLRSGKTPQFIADVTWTTARNQTTFKPETKSTTPTMVTAKEIDATASSEVNVLHTWKETSDSTNTIQLKKNLRQLQDDRMCKVCMDAVKNHVFIP